MIFKKLIYEILIFNIKRKNIKIIVIMKFTKDNSFFICHRCLYRSFLKTDMIKHYERKNICDIKYCETNSYTIDDYKRLSINKRYYTNHTLKHYPESVLIKYILNFHDEINIIDDDSDIYNIINNDKKYYITNNENMECDLKIENIEEYDLKIEEQDLEIEEYNLKIEENDLKNKNLENITKIENEDYMIIDNEIYYIISINNIDKINEYKGKKVIFKCYGCDTEYRKKFNFINHLQNDKLCHKKKLFNEYIKKCEDIKTENKHSQIIINNQNNNIQNNNHNDYGNYKLKLRDFFLEGYSIDHIDLDKLNYNDFYLYDNMLNLILENDENKNIYFDNNNAIFYTKNNLSVLPNDKAVYVLLEKMGSVANKIVNLQDEEAQAKLNHIKDYYRINLNKYKFDTIFKKYDVNEKKFIYDSDVPKNIRTRDECIQTTISIINNYEDDIQQIFKNKKLNTKKLPPPMPYNIEYYLSIKERYKELKDEY